MRTSFVFALLTTLAACGGGSDGGGGNSDSDGPAVANGFVATSVNDALDYALDRGLDAIWIFIDEGDGATAVHAAGVENRATLAPARAASQFKIASVSKMFIAVAGVKVINAGILKLDDTLAYWLPELAGRVEYADTMTVRQLLRHRSGVPDFDSAPGFSWTRPHTDNAALLALVLDKPADFVPDARYEYSNTNYLLLGMILDVALGYSHHDLVRNEILSPLGMVNTYSVLSETDASLLARGYWDGVDRTLQDYVAPGGSMISTAAEVGVFLRALATGELLDADEDAIFDALFTTGHSGWLPGYQSLAYYHAAMDTVVVQFVNNTGSGSEQTARQVYDSVVDYLRRQ